MGRVHATWAAAWIVVACSGTEVTPAPPKVAGAPTEERQPAESSASAAPASESAAEAAEETPMQLPTQCSKPEGTCTPDRKWVDRLCRATYPSVALAMFAKGTPWKRGYLTRKMQAWNAAGGASEPVQLEFDEEVIVLVERVASTGGIQVSGAGGGYEALRWDGGCVTLSKEELTLKRPPQPLAAKVEWRHLDASTRDVLSNDEKLKKAYQDRRKECKGANSGTVSLKCVKADTKLSQSIVEYVRNGGALGNPTRLP
jgi:hypothetical protein